MTTKQSINTTQNVYIPLVISGGILGVILSVGVLSGDELGRVNLLYLLFLYFVLPVVALVLTIITLIRGNHSTTFSRILHSSFFSIHTNEYYRSLRQQRLGSLWIFEQIQLFAISFSVLALVTFFMLLLVTDVSIIWRSTLLSPEDLYPLLKFIAYPWIFWNSAQPDLEILSATQDFRILKPSANPLSLAAWWPFVVAVQLTYALVPRLLIYLFLKLKISGSITELPPLSIKIAEQQPQPAAPTTIRLLSKLPAPVDCIAWDTLPEAVIETIKHYYPQLSFVTDLSWQPDVGALSQLLESDSKLIFVKSWEAPMAELGDELNHISGFICPINCRDSDLVTPLEVHLQEWSRFCQAIGWTVISLDEYCYE